MVPVSGSRFQRSVCVPAEWEVTKSGLLQMKARLRKTWAVRFFVLRSKPVPELVFWRSVAAMKAGKSPQGSVRLFLDPAHDHNQQQKRHQQKQRLAEVARNYGRALASRGGGQDSKPIQLSGKGLLLVIHQTPDPVLFENQRYQPVRGWGSKFPGHLLPTDRGRWSDRAGRLYSSEGNDLFKPEEGCSRFWEEALGPLILWFKVLPTIRLRCF